VGDEQLQRLGRNTAIACAAIALVALVIEPRAALGVLGGGVLVAISYLAVASSLGLLLASGKDAKTARNRAVALLIFVGHYALLGFAAYVMIARLRLHPVGLVGGATSFVVAAGVEALRPWTKQKQR
jgi:hypothetical protein